MSTVPGRLIGEWQAARAELRAIEETLHPAITDRFGREWVWIGGELYSHCGMAWTREMITNPRAGLPTEAARSNPNYDLCATCRGES